MATQQRTSGLGRRILAICLLSCMVAGAALGLVSCGDSGGSSYVQELRDDQQWMRELETHARLSYVEDGSYAAFHPFASYGLEPSLWATYDAVRLHGELDIEVPDAAAVVEYVESLRDADGSYMSHPYRPGPQLSRLDDTMRALTVLTELGTTPTEVAATTEFLLSQQCDDGTFLNSSTSMAEWEESFGDTARLNRITGDTYSVITSLGLLGQSDKVPEETKAAIADEIVHWLGDTGPLPTLDADTAHTLIYAVLLLAKIDPARVTERAAEFLVSALRDADYVWSGAWNKLLDLAEALGLPPDAGLGDEMRSGVEKELASWQENDGAPGIYGGFSPPELETIVLAQRLGIDCPHTDKITAYLNSTWLGNGWAMRGSTSLPQSLEAEYTYYGIEVAEFAGFEYDRGKMDEYLTSLLVAYLGSSEGRPGFEASGSSGGSGEPFMRVYYAIKGLKALNGELSAEQAETATATCLQLGDELLAPAAPDAAGEWRYAALAGRELGLRYPEGVAAKIAGGVASALTNIAKGAGGVPSEGLLEIWAVQPESEPELTKDKALEYLASIYDAESGAYTRLMYPPQMEPVPAGGGSASSAESPPERVPRGEISATYAAAELLRLLGGDLPDEEKTLEFVMSCKCAFGFASMPELPAGNRFLITTFAGLALLQGAE